MRYICMAAEREYELAMMIGQIYLSLPHAREPSRGA